MAAAQKRLAFHTTPLGSLASHSQKFMKNRERRERGRESEQGDKRRGEVMECDRKEDRGMSWMTREDRKRDGGEEEVRQLQ